MGLQKSQSNNGFQSYIESVGYASSRLDITKKILVLAIGSLLFGFLVSCKPETGTRIDPKAPKETYSRTEMEVRNEKYLSTVNVPVSISAA